ncbi:hypothetical protein J5X84_43115 [Streptosporangiaceae bacterium NEAU-GS5]|nr:hypothetical protein [Streptosporangiaceae bacterium NEAU-GS5]
MSQNPFARLTRWLGLDKNPLRRTCDRVEAAVRLAAIVGFLAALVFGVVLGAGTYGNGVRTEAAQARARHLTSATLQENVTLPKISAAGTTTGHAQATWKGPDASVWQGDIEAPPNARAGQVVKIWIDDHGKITQPPQDRETTVVAALTVGTGLPLFAAVMLGLGVLITRVVNVRRSRRAWEAQWTEVEPTWRING